MIRGIVDSRNVACSSFHLLDVRESASSKQVSALPESYVTLPMAKTYLDRRLVGVQIARRYFTLFVPSRHLPEPIANETPGLASLCQFRDRRPWRKN